MRRLLLILFLAVGLTACTTSQNAAPIRVAVLPILDTLPMYVAQAEGYFEEEGLSVEFVPVSSAPERDSLMQAGQIEAMINELVSVILFNQEDVEVLTVRFARTATDEYPVFRILSSAQSGITEVEQLVGVPIGISEGTVIEYTTDRILEKAGLEPAEIEKVAIPRIPDRYALLESNELDAANLPDPVASLAIQGGAYLVIDDTSYPEISHSIISFDAEFVRENPESVRAFLRAIERAVEAINSDKNRWDQLLVENSLIPPPLIESYTLPDYPQASVPSEAQFQDVMEWAISKNLVKTSLDYRDAVDDSYLP
jgi:NitT/TauT family transport system substrate-binding protein